MSTPESIARADAAIEAIRTALPHVHARPEWIQPDSRLYRVVSEAPPARRGSGVIVEAAGKTIRLSHVFNGWIVNHCHAVSPTAVEAVEGWLAGERRRIADELARIDRAAERAA